MLVQCNATRTALASANPSTGKCQAFVDHKGTPRELHVVIVLDLWLSPDCQGAAADCSELILEACDPPPQPHSSVAYLVRTRSNMDPEPTKSVEYSTKSMCSSPVPRATLQVSRPSSQLSCQITPNMEISRHVCSTNTVSPRYLALLARKVRRSGLGRCVKSRAAVVPHNLPRQPADTSASPG
jgi:hypothetical protein